jgi:ABC-type phosphate transport system substrate-binding protein
VGYQLGIDVGSASIIVAMSDGGWPQLLPLGGGRSIPSVLYLPPGGGILFGRSAQRRALADPGRSAQDFLRRLGDPDAVLVDGAAYTPEGLLSRLVGRVVAAAAEARGAEPDQVVVTHPTFWSERRHELFTDAVRQIDNVDVPVSTCTTADALGILLAQRAATRTVDIVGLYDFGAGSFDAAILSFSPYGFQVVGTPAGINHAGGADIDDLLVTRVLTAAGRDPGTLDRADQAVATALGRLRTECIQAKEILSEDDEVDVPVALPGLATSVRLTRTDVERLVEPCVEDTVRAFLRTLRSVPATAADLSSVLLYGGSARMPVVQRLLRAALPEVPRLELRPDEDAALGAALLAAQAAEQAAADGQGAGATVVIGRSAAVVDEPPPISSFPTPLSPAPAGPLSPPLSPPPAGPPSPAPAGLVSLAPVSLAAGSAAMQPPTALAAVPAPTVGDHGAVAPAEESTPGGGRFSSTQARVVLAAAVALVLVAAGTTLGLTRAGDDSTPAVLAPVTTGAGGGPTSPPLTGTARNLVRVAGSAEVAPITETAYAKFRERQANVTVSVDTSTTEDGFARLCRGDVAIADASFELTPSAVKDPGCAGKVVGFEIAHHTLPVVVNPQNTWARCLSLEQLRKVWGADSTVTRWNQIDGSYPNEPITFLGPARDSVQARVFNSTVNDSSEKSRAYRATDLPGVAQTVSTDRDAIGFLDFPTYQTFGSRLRALEIDNGKGCVEPNAVAAGTGLYLPLCKPLFVYARLDALRDPATAAFMRFYLANGQQIAFDAHYVPRNQETTNENVSKINGLTAGVGPIRT